jgi:hypothetical protein
LSGFAVLNIVFFQEREMTHKKSKTVIASAVSLALASMMLAGGAYAGVIRNTNPTPGAPLGSCGPTQAATQACVGAMDLTNIETTIYKADGTVLGTMDTTTGDYPAMGIADYFVSLVKSAGAVVAKLGGKVWPVGEPMAVKSVVGDMNTSHGKPNNCIINTAYITADKNPDGTSGLLNTLEPLGPIPVICSSDFQTHKRFKIPMQPAALDPATPIDLVFNVVDESVWANANGLPGNTVTNSLNPNNLRPYQVFSKINNYTGKRLAGFKVIVGTGTGTAFKSASALGIEGKLQISLGLNEAANDVTVKGVKTFYYNNENLFDDEGGMATFSHGLFGAPDKHFSVNGFFDRRTAGFDAVTGCEADPAMTTKCLPYANPYIPVDPAVVGGLADLKATDMIYSTKTLESNYNGPTVLPQPTAGLPFGDWLPFGWNPKGIFWDFDNDPTTDADLVAWWNGSAWLKNFDSGFTPATTAELDAWAKDPLYAIDDIEDTVNLGINYILKVGDGIGTQFTVRIIPIVAADQTQPPYVTTPPPALVPTTPTTPTTPTEPTTPTPTVPVVSSGGGGGGCAIGNDGRFDPTLPAMLFAGLGFLGWRRYKAGK